MHADLYAAVREQVSADLPARVVDVPPSLQQAYPLPQAVEGSALVDELRRLRVVVAVLSQGGVRRAAETLHLSQPAVSRSIQELERHLGLLLFERAARGMVPTRAGRVLGMRGQQALDHLRRGAIEALEQAPAKPRAPRHADRFPAMVGSRPLACLLAIAQAGSEPRAAERLGLSQPGVHRALCDLEALAGVALFHRTPRGTRLTDSGEALLRSSKLAVSEIRFAEDELAAFNGRIQGRVVVGTLPLSSGFLVPRAIDRVLMQHPELQVTVVDGTYDALLTQLRCADVDFVVGALRPALPADLVQEPLFEDTLAVIVRASHACARCSPRKLADLADQQWIVPLPGTPARAIFERSFRAEGLAMPPTSLQVNSPAVVRAMLAETDRLALLSPRQVANEIHRGLLTVLPVALTGAQRTIGLTTRREGAPAPGAKVLIDLMHDMARELRAV